MPAAGAAGAAAADGAARPRGAADGAAAAAGRQRGAGGGRGRSRQALIGNGPEHQSFQHNVVAPQSCSSSCSCRRAPVRRWRPLHAGVRASWVLDLRSVRSQVTARANALSLVLWCMPYACTMTLSGCRALAWRLRTLGRAGQHFKVQVRTPSDQWGLHVLCGLCCITGLCAAAAWRCTC